MWLYDSMALKSPDPRSDTTCLDLSWLVWKRLGRKHTLWMDDGFKSDLSHLFALNMLWLDVTSFNVQFDLKQVHVQTFPGCGLIMPILGVFFFSLIEQKKYRIKCKNLMILALCESLSLPISYGELTAFIDCNGCSLKCGSAPLES